MPLIFVSCRQGTLSLWLVIETLPDRPWKTPSRIDKINFHRWSGLRPDSTRLDPSEQVVTSPGLLGHPNSSCLCLCKFPLHVPRSLVPIRAGVNTGWTIAATSDYLDDQTSWCDWRCFGRSSFYTLNASAPCNSS